jgi:hypothetical protein
MQKPVNLISESFSKERLHSDYWLYLCVLNRKFMVRRRHAHIGQLDLPPTRTPDEMKNKLGSRIAAPPAALGKCYRNLNERRFLNRRSDLEIDRLWRRSSPARCSRLHPRLPQGQI